MTEFGVFVVRLILKSISKPHPDGVPVISLVIRKKRVFSYRQQEVFTARGDLQSHGLMRTNPNPIVEFT